MCPAPPPPIIEFATPLTQRLKAIKSKKVFLRCFSSDLSENLENEYYKR